MKNYNTNLVLDAKRIFVNKGDGFDEVEDNLVPVVPIIPLGEFTNSFSRATTGTNTAFVSSSDKDTYITGIIVTLLKDATCDMGDGTVRVICTVNGGTMILCYIPIITLTAQSIVIPITFPNPIRLDRGTSFNYEGTFTVGKCIRTITVTGYVLERSGAI